ncbi:lantibiotic dehydratase [Cytobacillus sp. FSL K6-0265]|uniref:lantibiotic dehydratase n=1 Tax=Cytobacillus sp. FSL K6-0265 TaxID=2921448 RepID=UPI0030F5433D
MVSPILEKKIQTNHVDNSRLYQAMDFFMLRTPLLPSYNYNQLNTNDLYRVLCSYTDNLVIKEALLLASPSLYDSLEYLYRNPEEKKTKQLMSSLYRYINRMSTRPTPFGLFSGVTTGEFSQYTQINIGDVKKHKKRSRPDMEWLLKLIFTIELDKLLIDEIKVSKNNLVTKVGARLKIPYAVRNKNNQEISINLTEPVEFILNNSADWILFKDLIEKLQIKYRTMPKEMLKDFVLELINQEVLLTELRPPLQTPSPFDYLLEQLKKIDMGQNYIKDLLEIKKIINAYDKQPIGEGIHHYKKLKDKMQSLIKTDKVLQVDTLLHTSNNRLNKFVGEEFAIAAECLWSLSSLPTRPYTHLQDYQKIFVENYGTYTEVPILELLSEELGLGIPDGYKDNNVTPSSILSTPIQQKLLDVILLGIKNNDKTIYLEDDLVKEAKRLKKIESAPDSYELYGEIIAESADAIDAGNFEIILSPLVGSREAGQTFGRFFDIIDPNVLQEFKNTHSKLQDMIGYNSVFVEASYLSASLRTNNLTLGEKYRDYELTIGTNNLNKNKKIDINDICVVSSSTQLFFISKKLQKEVIFVGGNMLNYQSSPAIYKFMREVSESRITHWNPLDKNFLVNLPYVPRIKYKKTILSPAKWRFSKQILESESFLNDSDEKWINSFQHWRKKWKIPRYVFMTYADNRILLDLQNSYSILEIKNQIKKTPNISLIENIVLNRKGLKNEFGWVKDENNKSFTMECVVPLVKNNNSIPKASLDVAKIQRSASTINKKEINKLPGENYFYTKLYIPNELQDKFIINELQPFALEMIEKKIIENYFFMRYKDTKDHLRIRFKGSSKLLNHTLFNEFITLAKQWFNNGIIKKYSIDTYEREINRYGGPQLIDIAENFFYYDSLVTLKKVSLINSKKVKLPKEAVAVISIIDFLHQTGLSYDEQISFLERFVSKDDFMDEYRNYRKHLVKISDPYNAWEGLQNDDSINSLHDCLLTRGTVLRKYFVEIDRLEQLGDSWNSKYSILNSLIHMHCNRLMGINRKLETKTYAFARHTLYSQRYWRNKKNGKH